MCRNRRICPQSGIADISSPRLPIHDILPEILAHLDHSTNLVLQAPPGAGKTTGVPLALLGRRWRGDGRIIVLEPRRLAARAAAARMASTLSEEVGETCGYRVRLESRISVTTRIEVVTDGLFTRLIQNDASLEGVAAVLFDEFHERRLETDLALALCLESQAVLRPDLRLIVMSATLDSAPVAELMGGCPVVTAAGRSYPVTINHLAAPRSERLGPDVAAAIVTALDHSDGDILVFLPGNLEIRQTERALREMPLAPGVPVFPLHGDLEQSAQDRALAPPSAGHRKVVLATAIAETSLTIPGIRHVIDAGFARSGRYDPRTGMTRLETTRVSQAGADQRAGRAGRTAPGICWRLWPEAQHRALDRFTAPEITHADLAPLLLELAQWGTPDPASLRLLDQPSGAALAAARALLINLGALTPSGGLTPHGGRMAELALHPRLAHMLLMATQQGQGPLAAAIAAVLGERWSAPGPRDSDLRTRLEFLVNVRGVETARRAVDAARRLTRQLGIPWQEFRIEDAGAVLALAYPDRIAERRGGPGRFRLSGGQGAWIPESDPLAAAPFLAVAELDGQAPQSRIWLAAPVAKAELEISLADRVETLEDVAWDDQTRSVQAKRRRLLGALTLHEQRIDNPPAKSVLAALIDGIRRLGIDCLPWSDGALALRHRIGFIARLEGDRGNWPAFDDVSLLNQLEDWLGDALLGRRSHADLQSLDLESLIRERLDWDQRRQLDAIAPTHITVPRGSRVAIQYDPDGPPVLAVKLQEMFGLAQTPAIAHGQVTLQLHLLSPARRPIQVTSDLAGFWSGSYRAVRAELRGRYPRHPWPEDPVNAVATARAKPRGT